MLRLLADENFNGDIVRGLLLRQPDLDIVRVQDVGLGGADDPDILAWQFGPAGVPVSITGPFPVTATPSTPMPGSPTQPYTVAPSPTGPTFTLPASQ